MTAREAKHQAKLMEWQGHVTDCRSSGLTVRQWCKEKEISYRPKRSAQQAIQKVKEYAEKGYTQAVLIDLSKYFDTLNHELLMNLLRKHIHE